MTIKRILNVSGNSPVEINRQLSHIMDVLNEADNNHTTNVGDISTLQSDMNTAQSDITTLQSKNRGMTWHTQCIATNPADSTTYYFGSNPIVLSATEVGCYIPFNGRITKCIAYIRCTAGTAETASLYIKHYSTSATTWTDYLVSTTSIAEPSLFYNYDMDIPVKNLDAFTMKLITPAWVTNPTGLTIGGFVYEEFD